MRSSALLLAVAALGCTIAPSMDRAPLDQIWEEYMLAGTSATVDDGRRVQYVPKRSFEEARGSPFAAFTLERGIAVCDQREERLGGLYSNGGWCLYGGLLARFATAQGIVELYGKQIDRVFLSLPRPPHTEGRPEESFEFFLLHRPGDGARAVSIKKWVFPSSELSVSPAGVVLVYGYLKYDATTKTAIVTVTGLVRPFEESVKLSAFMRD